MEVSVVRLIRCRGMGWPVIESRGGRERVLAIWLIGCLAVCAASSQELEPRAYRSLPIGLNFVLFNFGYSTGNVLTDPTSPVQDLDLSARTTTVAYLRSMSLFGRSASISFSQPHGYVSGSAKLAGELITGSRSGPADLKARLTVNLVGGPALTLAEFATYRQRRNLGVSLTAVAPTGQYDPSRLINFGSNRWSLKPEIGYSSIRGRWILEGALGVWVFTENSNYLGGSKLSQDPIGSLQAHVSYNLKPTLWLALDGNYFTGGDTTVDGEPSTGLQRASRVGLTLSLPIRRRHSLKLAAQTGVFTRIGAEFDVVSIAYLYQWGGAGRH